MEAVNNVKDYLKTRESVKPEDYVFAKFGREDQPVAPSVLTHIFNRIVLKLRKKGVLTFETSTKKLQITTRDHKRLREHITRSEVRLYCLRKFFRKHAGLAGADFVNFWMGHTRALGVDLHYFSKNAEHHRTIYRGKAMPHLQLETSTPSEIDVVIQRQTEEIEELRDMVFKQARMIKELQRFVKHGVIPVESKEEKETLEPYFTLRRKRIQKKAKP